MDEDRKQYIKGFIDEALVELWNITDVTTAPKLASKDVIENYNNFNSGLDGASMALSEARDYVDSL